MADHLYTTKGIILRRSPFSEANILASIFTERLGLVHAVAQSSRRENSKLRFGLMPLSVGEYTLVSGNRFRLIGAVVEENAPATSAHMVRTMGRIAGLLSRLMPGTEAHPELFRVVREGFILMRGHGEDEAVVKNIECMLVLRTLDALGYLPEISELKPFLAGENVTAALAREFDSVRPSAIRTINSSLSASGL